jgi:hypothetical protein
MASSAFEFASDAVLAAKIDAAMVCGTGTCLRVAEPPRDTSMGEPVGVTACEMAGEAA